MTPQDTARFFALLADVLALVTADALAQRIDQVQQGQRLAEQHREAQDLAAAVDAWLSEGDTDDE